MKQFSQPTSKNELARTILVALGAVGVISMALVAPNALQILAPTNAKRRRRISPWDIERALDRLITGGYVERRIRRGDELVGLTKRGHDRLHALQLRDLRIATPPKWDGKWRLVFFDIPHVKGMRRDAIRRKLQGLGFLRIQKSVYLHPFECYDIIQQLRGFYRMKPHCHYAVVEKIEGAQEYRHHFKLNR